MEILRTIALYSESKAMRFIVVGGQAVNAYGISRQTGDIDLIVEGSRKADWSGLLERLKYKPHQDDDRFSRYQPPELAAWPIDLMYVDDLTFEKLFSAARDMIIGVSEVAVVSPEHLVALKIHALKNFQPHREPKDYGDLLALLRTAASNIDSPELEQLCLRYASHDLYDRLNKDLGR